MDTKCLSRPELDLPNLGVSEQVIMSACAPGICYCVLRYGMLKGVMCVQVLADIEAKFRVKMAASNGRLEDAMDSVTLHDGRRRPGRRSNYENLLKVCPIASRPHNLGLCNIVT